MYDVLIESIWLTCLFAVSFSTWSTHKMYMKHYTFVIRWIGNRFTAWIPKSNTPTSNWMFSFQHTSYMFTIRWIRVYLKWNNNETFLNVFARLAGVSRSPSVILFIAVRICVSININRFFNHYILIAWHPLFPRSTCQHIFLHFDVWIDDSRGCHGVTTVPIKMGDR